MKTCTVFRELYHTDRKAFYRAIGRNGGDSTFRKYGRMHMRAIGRMGAWSTNGPRTTKLVYMGM